MSYDTSMSHSDSGQGVAQPNNEQNTADKNQAQGANQGNGQVPSMDGISKEAAREAIRKFKIKHQDGNEEEVAEDEVLKIYRERKGHQAASNKALQEGKAAKKQAEEFISMMKDPAKVIDVMEKLGYSKKQIREMSENYLSGALEEEMMDPRDRELRDIKAKLKAREDLEKQTKEAQQKKIDDAMKAKYREKYNNEFVEVLKAEKLPPTKAMVAEMAKYIHRAAKMQFEMTTQEAAKLVKEDIENSYKNLYGESDAETLVRLLGEQGLQKIRQYDTSRLKDPNAVLKTPTEQGEIGQRRRDTTKRMSTREWRNFNRK